MKVRSFRLPSVVAGVFVLSCVGSTAAYAGVAWGQEHEIGPYGGYTYVYQSRVSTDSGDATGGVSLRTKHWNQVPSGYMRVQASLWKNGSFCVDTPWQLNSQPIVSMQYTTFAYGDCGPGYYWGDGQIGVYRPSQGTYAYGYPVNSPTQYQSN